jgi:hypothetical protein
VKNNPYFINIVRSDEIRILALKGDKAKALKRVDDLRNYPDEAKERLRREIDSY